MPSCVVVGKKAPNLGGKTTCECISSSYPLFAFRWECTQTLCAHIPNVHNCVSLLCACVPEDEKSKGRNMVELAACRGEKTATSTGTKPLLCRVFVLHLFTTTQR